MNMIATRFDPLGYNTHKVIKLVGRAQEGDTIHVFNMSGIDIMLMWGPVASTYIPSGAHRQYRYEEAMKRVRWSAVGSYCGNGASRPVTIEIESRPQ